MFGCIKFCKSNRSVLQCETIVNLRYAVSFMDKIYFAVWNCSSCEHFFPFKIQALLERTGYTLDVTTGQRKYGGPPPDTVYSGSQPGIGTEVCMCSIYICLSAYCCLEVTLIIYTAKGYSCLLKNN